MDESMDGVEMDGDGPVDQNHEDTMYQGLSPGNYSGYPSWVTGYMECTMLVGQRLNLSVSEQVWLGLLRSSLGENNTAIGTLIENSILGTNAVSSQESSTKVESQLFNQSGYIEDIAPAYVIGSGYLTLNQPTEVNNGQITTAMPLYTTSGSLESTTFQEDTSVSVVNAVANWCLAEITNDRRPYLLAWWQQVLWTLAFGLMLTVAIGGNSLVMWIVCGKS